MALPPFEEQQRIVAFIDRATEPLNVALTKLEREIELLREYRTRLVADVVTGKLDMCEAATRLPNEVMPDITEALTGEADDTEFADEEAAA